MDYNKRTTLMEDVDNEGCCACVEARGVWELSVQSAQFCYKPKTALKQRLLINKTKHGIIEVPNDAISLQRGFTLYFGRQ